MGGLTFDTSALVALERYRSGIAKVVATARADRLPITIPASSVAEWWRGRTDRREFVLKLGEVRPLDETIARLAGLALASLGGRGARIDDRITIDATVMATAALHGPIVYTGDFDDLDRFAAFFPSVRILGLSR